MSEVFTWKRGLKQLALIHRISAGQLKCRRGGHMTVKVELELKHGTAEERVIAGIFGWMLVPQGRGGAQK